MSDAKDIPISSNLTLSSRSDWPLWFKTLQFESSIRGVWDLINPDAVDVPMISSTAPKPYNTMMEHILKLNAERALAVAEWDHADPITRGNKPNDQEAQEKDVRLRYEHDMAKYNIAYKEWSITSARYAHVYNWVRETVSDDLLGSTISTVLYSGEVSLQGLIRDLRDQLAPTSLSVVSSARKEYRAVLKRASQGRINPNTWIKEWRNVYTTAKLYKIPDIEGTVAIIDFLDAVSKLAPSWASKELADVVTADELGLPSKTLDQYGRVFMALLHENSNRSSGKSAPPAFFATLGHRSDDYEGKSRSRSRSANREDKACPCKKKEGTKWKHTWEPQDCARLELAITGSSNRKLKGELSADEINSIRQRLNAPTWKWLVAKKNWEEFLFNDKRVQKPSSSTKSRGAKAKSSADDNLDDRYPGNIVAVTMDPRLVSEHMGVYATLGNTVHPLSKSTVFDTCGAMHLVNDKRLLEPGSFRPAQFDEVVECGSSQLPILGKGKRVIRNLLTSKSGERTADLELSDVVFVEGFHVNIVSEARLLEAGVWFHGLNCSLRYGDEGSSVEVAKLTRKHNLIFIELKSLSTYLSILSVIPTSAAGILMSPTMKRSIRHSFRRSRDCLKPRRDSEELWHARAGHLGRKALRALVHAARNVEIEGISRIECEHCSKAYGKSVVSRRAPERRSPRPFWRVLWDLFDFPISYNGTQWLLVLKDEYSGKLFAFALTSKALIDVLPQIREFEAWTRRQYGLSICKFKHDNEKAVIGIKGLTQYEIWAAKAGIDLELTPSNTHEPNGGAERAGQEVIVRSIVMRDAANLPEKLWPECAQAAVYLYNMSPSEAHDLRSPNEVLDSWFRQYFRWYEPEIVTRITVDLRPDWNGIYVYGARAYPLIKEREAGKEKRAFKVMPRAHIGYLVGYVASNIYRIWVPQLDQVIVTRNVVFDESKLYSKTLEQQAGQPVAITKMVLEVIEEDETDQDAGSIINHHIPSDDIQVEIAEEPAAPLGGVLSSKGSMSRNSGVSSERGLPTPEQTPEPVTGHTASGSPGGDQSIATADESIVHSGAQLTEHAGTERSAPTHSEHRSIGGQKVPMVIIRQPRNPPDLAQGQKVSSAREEAPESTVPKTRRSKRAVEPSSRLLRSHKSTLEDNDPRDRLNLVTMIPQISDALSTLWPDHPRSAQDDRQCKTVHAVIAASVLQNRVSRQGATEPLSLPHVHRNDLPPAPSRWSDLKNHEYGAHFMADAETEIQNLESRNCWRMIPISEASTTPIPLKWVFTYKVDSSGTLIRCRSRIVVRGDLQEEQTIISTYAATLASRSFRVAMALAARFDLEVKQFDVVNAFVNVTRDTRSQPVACKLPDGFKKPRMCVEIDRALYGLRDSPALWYEDFSSTLKETGLSMCKEEPCLFIDELRKIFVLFYVDDVLILNHRDDQEKADSLIHDLGRKYELRDLGDVEWFLGVRVIRDRVAQKIWLVHDTYIEKIAKKFGLDTWKCPSTPLPGLQLVKSEGDPAPSSRIKEFQEKVGSLLYSGIMIRADVAYAAAQLSHFLTNPSDEHISAVNWAIMYLWGTRFLAIMYGGENVELQQLLIASDTSFADDPVTRRSSQGYIMMLFGGLILWKAARQATVSTSTTEAELLGVEHTAKETMALQRFFKELCLVLDDPWTIFCDNQQTIRLITGESMRITTKLRHVDIQNMWLRQEHAFGRFEVTYLPTDQMPADGLTKNLPRYKFEHFRSLLNLQDVRGMIEKIKTSKEHH